MFITSSKVLIFYILHTYATSYVLFAAFFYISFTKKSSLFTIFSIQFIFFSNKNFFHFENVLLCKNLFITH